MISNINFEINEKNYFLNSINIKEIIELDFLRDFIEDLSCIFNKTEEEVLLVALLFLTNAVNNKLLVQHTENEEYLVSSNLWGILIAEPGSGKSPLIQYFKKFLIEAENYYNKDKEQKLIIYKHIKKAIQKRPTQKNIEDLKKILDNPPRLNYLFANNITKEALLKYLSFNEQGVLLHFDELSSLFAKFKKDSEYRSLLLEGWNGIGTYKYTTLKDTTLKIQNFGIGIIANIQPPLFKKFFSNSEDGFKERFQILILLSNTPPKIINKSLNKITKQKMQELFFKLTDPNLSKNFSSKIIKFSPSALLRYIYFKQKFQEQYLQNYSSYFKSYWAKLDKLVLSLSLVFFLLRFFYSINKQEEINVQDLEKAIIVTKFLLKNVLILEKHFLNNDRDNFEKKVVLKIFELLNNKSNVSFRKVIQNIYHLHNNEELINILNKIKHNYPIDFEKNHIFLKSNKTVF